MLLACRHADPLSAGVSIAENRADKAQRLRTAAATTQDSDYAAQLRRIADRYARNLANDVSSFVAFEYAQLAHGEQVPDNVCERLHAAVARARGEVTIVTTCPPLLDRSYTGSYLRDRPEDGGFVLEVDGAEVTFGPEYRDQLGA
jgi:hypothetical protein